MKDKLFVIVVTYKGRRWYERCFTSLRNSKYPIQTVVIDNASNDGTCEYIRDKFPEILLIESKENLGFGRANNIGIRYALDNGCDYVFLLNQDAWIEPNTLEKLINIHKKNPEYGILSPMHLNVDKTQLMMKRFSSQTNNAKLINDLYFNKIDDVYETKYIHAAAWMLSKDILISVGGFDPIFFHYGEDDNYLHRASYHKFKIGVCPKAQIVHDHQGSSLSNLEYREKISWLVDWTNINHKLSAVNLYRYYFRKLFLFLICGNFKEVKIIYNKLCFFLNKRKAIYKSRNEDIVRKPSWLKS